METPFATIRTEFPQVRVVRYMTKKCGMPRPTETELDLPSLLTADPTEHTNRPPVKPNRRNFADHEPRKPDNKSCSQCHFAGITTDAANKRGGSHYMSRISATILLT
jgi:hypothetical protein